MENSDSASSSDESDIDVDKADNSKLINSREKRDLAWCGVDTEVAEKPPRATWPPPPESPSTSSWLNLRHVRVGNPLYGTKMQLHCRTNHYLAVYADGTVRGTPDEDDLHTYLELMSGGQAGHVKIKGLLTNSYVAMDKKGRLYAESDPMEEASVFIESFQGQYKTYLSKSFAHLGWYIGIKKSGKFKRGPKTQYGQKAIKFLSVRSKFE